MDQSLIMKINFHSHFLSTRSQYTAHRVVWCSSPTILVCRVTAQCENTGCMAAECDGTCDYVKVIFI